MTDGHAAAARASRALLEALDRAFVAAGKDPRHLTPVDLGAVDEFHVGGRRATAEFATVFAAAASEGAGHLRGRRLLDVGCGLGGAARHFASTFGCHVSATDLRVESVVAAAELTRRRGIGDLVAFVGASALALPFAAGMFDGAYMLHVGMNIADKASLFAEIRRVLTPGAVFGVYDVMRAGPGDVIYPLPWAADAGESFVDSPADYRARLAASGFSVIAEHDRSPSALEFFRRVRQRADETGAPVGLHLVMGATAATRAANIATLIERGILAPVHMLARAA